VKRIWYVSAALALAALLIPVRGTVAFLVGTGSPRASDIATGVLIFKGMLLLHALLLGVLSALPSLRYGGGSGDKEGAPPTRRAIQWEALAVATLIGAAAWLRLHGLNQGMWFDEVETLVKYARLPIGQIITTFDSQNQHMLYSILARASIVVFGESPAALRLPAVLFGVASLWALYWFGTLVAGRRQALLATALLTFSYHHVWFSQNARGYTGLLLWTLVGSALFVKLLDEKRSPGWLTAAGYGLAMALAVYTHVTAAFVVAGHGLIWLALLMRWPERRQGKSLWLPLIGFVLAGTLSLQLYALVLPQFLATLLEPTMEGMATEWKNPLWLITETLRVLGQGLPGGIVAVVAGIAIVLTGVISYVKQDAKIAGIMLAPGLLMAGVLLATQHNMWPRFFFFAAGFAVLIAIRGGFVVAEAVLRTRGRQLATVAMLVVIAGSAYTVPGAYYPKQDYDGARKFVEQQRGPEDAVVTVDMSRVAYQNYFAPQYAGISSEQELEQLEAKHPRTWILYTFPTRLKVVQPGIWDRLQRRYATAAEFPGTVGGGAVVVKVSK